MVRWVCFQYSYCCANVERHVRDLAQVDVALADAEFLARIALERAAVAAAARLVKDEIAVLRAELAQELRRSFRDRNPLHHWLARPAL
jgi:hypothetical protein